MKNLIKIASFIELVFSLLFDLNLSMMNGPVHFNRKIIFNNRAQLLKIKGRKESNFFIQSKLKPVGKESILSKFYFKATDYC